MRDVIEMARESWLDTYGLGKDHNSFVEALKRFADLVRADEREAIIDLVAAYGGPADLKAAIRARYARYTE